MTSRIVFALVALSFVQLVNSQMACSDAQTALNRATTCLAAFSAGTDSDVICIGSCRTIFDNIINSCDSTVSFCNSYAGIRSYNRSTYSLSFCNCGEHSLRPVWSGSVANPSCANPILIQALFAWEHAETYITIL